MRATRRTTALVLACMAMGCSIAAAQEARRPLAPGSTIALLPGGNLSEAENDPRVLRALTEAIRLLGHRPLEPVSVRKRLEQTGARELCLSLSGCDRERLMKTLAVDAVIVYSLWYENEKPDEFAVELTRPEAQGQATQEIGARDLKTVIQAVLAQALADAESSRTTSLAIESVPASATVSVDGHEQGRAPQSIAVRPGRHQIKAELDGYVSVLDYVEVSKQDLVVHYTARLLRNGDVTSTEIPRSPGADPQDDRSDRTRKPSVLNYVFGAVLAAASIGLFAYGIATASANDHCDRRDAASRCVAIKNNTAPAVVALSAAGVSALGSGVFFALQPIASASSAERRAGLELHVLY